MCSVHALITSAIAHMGEDEDITEETLKFEFVQWFYPLSLKVNVSLPNTGPGRSTGVYQKLLQLVPRLSEHLMGSN